MSQAAKCRSPARKSKYGESKGTQILSIQYLARCLEQGNVNNSITTGDTLKRQIKETLFIRHRSTVESLMIEKGREATLQASHTKAVNQAVNSQRRNVVLDDLPPLINIYEKELTKSRISKDASLDVCADFGKKLHDVKPLFKCPAHPTIMTLSDLWNRPVEVIRQLSYLEAGVLD